MKFLTGLSILGIAFLTASLGIAGDHKIPTAPADYQAMENEIDAEDPDNAGLLKKSKRKYKSKCKKCHGATGAGDGSAAEEMLPPKPTNLSAAGYMESRSDGQLFWITKFGSKGTEMKGYGEGSDTNMSDDEIWGLIAWMRANFTN